MQALNLLTSSNWEHLVITLLHTLWQGTLAGLVLLVTLRFLSASRANARYVVSLSALALTVFAGVFTFAILESVTPMSVATVSQTLPDHQEIPAHEAAQPVSAPAPRSAIVTPDTGSHASWNIAWKPVVAAVWLFGVSMMLLRIVVLVAGTSGLRRAEPVTDAAVLEMVEALGRQLGLSRTIRVISTTKISTPAVFGVLWPVLVLPASFASGVAPDQLRLILSHELAHIRRHDYLVNLAQMMVEAVLFFNPAIWWISRQVRTEREACADALAVRQTESPDDYVAALAEWAEAGHHGALAQNFAGDARRGSLLDRVRRLLIPHYQPTAKMPWLSLIAVFLVAAAVFAGMHWGGKKVVAVAVQIMSAKERVEAVVKVQQEVAPQLTKKWPEKRTLSGNIATEDGGAITGGFLSYRTKLANGNSLGSNGSHQGNTFKIEIANGITKLVLFADGYAPEMLSFEPGPSEHVSGIHVVLKRGFPGNIRFIDEKGKPIPGVHESHSFQFSLGNSIGWGNSDSTSSSDGIVTVKHVSSTVLWMLNINCPGYQQRRIDNFSFAPNKTQDIELRRAQPTTGVVVDTNGRPIIGAKVIVSEQDIGQDRLTDRMDGILADEKGAFTFDTLADGTDHTLYAVSPGHGPSRLRKVRAGRTDLRIILSGQRRVRGTITGDLSLLPEYRGTRRIKLVHTVHAPGGSGSSWYTGAEVKIDGDVGRFETRDFLPGILTIQLANETQEVELVDGAVLDLDLVIRETTVQKRPVVVRFHSTDDLAMVPSGTVSVDTFSTDNRRINEHHEFEIEDGQIRFDTHMPGKIKCNAEVLPGYWFKSEWIPIALEQDDIASEPLQIDIDLKPAGAVSGRIVDSSGKPLVDSSTRITWKLAKDDQRKLGQHEMPRFVECKLGPGGQFFLAPFPLDAKAVISVVRDKMVVFSDAIELDKANPTSTVKLVMPKGQMLSGKVLDETGKPMSGIKINIRLKNTDIHGTISWGPYPRTDLKGSFRDGPFNPAAAEYQVTVASKRDYIPTAKNIENFADPVTIRLQRGKVLTGQVLDEETGWPIEGTEVYAILENLRGFLDGVYVYEAEEKTDSQGRFRLSNLPDMRVNLNPRQVNMKANVAAVPGSGQRIVLRGTLTDGSRARIVKPKDSEESPTDD